MFPKYMHIVIELHELCDCCLVAFKSANTLLRLYHIYIYTTYTRSTQRKKAQEKEHNELLAFYTIMPTAA